VFGFLCVNKPKGITSHAAVSKIRKRVGIKKIGHSGTLDPFATGVLVVCFGNATRLIEYLNEDKGYIATLKFGEVSDTYDIDGKIEKFSDKIVNENELEEALCAFTGVITQTPPKYSAISVNGKRLYEYARSGQEVEIPSRNVEITRLELLEFNKDEQCAKIKVLCSKGTYIRSLGYDIGLKLGSGAYLTDLIRIKSGDFFAENALEIEEITRETKLIAPQDALNLNILNLSRENFKRIKHGNAIEASGFQEGENLLLLYENKVSAVGCFENGKIKVKKVLI